MLTAAIYAGTAFISKFIMAHPLMTCATIGTLGLRQDIKDRKGKIVTVGKFSELRGETHIVHTREASHSQI